MQSTDLITNNKFVELIKSLNENLEDPYKFHLDPIISNNGQITGYTNSLLCDNAIIPIDLSYTIKHDKTCMSIVKWINRRLYMESLEDLCKNELTSFKTRIVRLRIAINMSFSMVTVLNDIEKEEWRQHITSLFYKRFFAISQYYSMTVLELPF